MSFSQRYRGVLFDMDGVLLDTMGAHAQAWVRAGAELGMEIDEREVYRREGEKGEVSARDFIMAAGLMSTRARARTLLAAKEAKFSRLARAPRMFPPAVEAVAACRARGMKTALVTGTSRGELQQILPAELAGLFDASVCGDEVLRGKPNPEPYLKAAMALGLQASQCVAVENAPYGIRSAKTAGCYVVALRSYLSDEDLVEADLLLNDLAELTERL